MAAVTPDLEADFESITNAQWESRVSADLRGRTLSTLDSKVIGGITTRPLYSSLPPGGPWTCTNGGRWQIVQELDPTATLSAASLAHQQGAEALALTAVERTKVADVLSELQNVELPIWLELTGEGQWGSVPGVSSGDRLMLHDPMGTVREAVGETELRAMAEAVAGPDRGVIAHRAHISAVRYHEEGAGAVEELAFSLATALSYLRALEAAGCDPQRGAARLRSTLSVDADFLTGIPKVRAMKVLLAKLLAGSGLSAHHIPVHGRTSLRMGSSLEPHLNLLRNTAGAFAAVVGGADSLSVVAHDAALAATTEGSRLALNLQQVFKEEAHLGRVADPARGSYAFETLTDELARAAWTLFQEIETRGGMVKVLAEGWVQERLDRAAEARLGALSRRELSMVGVNRFVSSRVGGAVPRSGPTLRDASPFEALRSRASALSAVDTRAYVIGIGDRRTLKPRLDFAEELLRVGGLHPAQFDVADLSSVDAALQSREKASTVVVCAADSDYEGLLPVLEAVLRRWGAVQVWVATKPTPKLRSLGVDAFVYRHVPTLELFSGLLDVLEARP